MRPEIHMKIRPVAHAALLSLIATLAACGGGGGQADDTGLPPRDITVEVQEYYKTKVSVPPAVRESFERG